MTTTTPSPSIRVVLALALVWLTRHPEIPVINVGVTDVIELDLQPGETDALLAVAAVAEALTDAVIATKDPARKRVTTVVVSGTADGDVELIAEVVVREPARTALLTSLTVAPMEGTRTWWASAAHLREVAERLTADLEAGGA